MFPYSELHKFPFHLSEALIKQLQLKIFHENSFSLCYTSTCNSLILKVDYQVSPILKPLYNVIDGNGKNTQAKSVDALIEVLFSIGYMPAIQMLRKDTITEILLDLENIMSIWLESDLLISKDIEQLGFVCKIQNDIRLQSMPYLKRNEYIFYSTEHAKDCIMIHTSGERVFRVFYNIYSLDIVGELKAPHQIEFFTLLAEKGHQPAITYMRKHTIDSILEELN